MTRTSTPAPRRTSSTSSPAARRRQDDAERVLGSEDASLLDIVDNVLSKGVVLTGELTIALAQVDLVYARLSLLLCAADRVMPGEDSDPIERRSARHAARVRRDGSRRRARQAPDDGTVGGRG